MLSNVKSYCFACFVQIDPPLVKILAPRQIIGARIGSWALLECYIEAYPEPFIDWIFGSKFLIESNKHNMTEQVLETRLDHVVSRKVSLNITKIDRSDFGLYKCEARNNKGRTHGVIDVYG